MILIRPYVTPIFYVTGLLFYSKFINIILTMEKKFFWSYYKTCINVVGDLLTSLLAHN